MADEFGLRLRRERERRKISLQSISANTKVSIGLFEALERDDLSRWPSGIFRRSFVRSYAEAIGLDGDETVREFLEHFPDPEAADAHADTADQARAPALRLTLADTWMPFTGGTLLPAVVRRAAAVAIDAGVILLVGLALFLILESFWIPLSGFMAVYYWGGILILGNTPGVCLQAPNSKDGDSSSGSAARPRRFSLDVLRSRFAAGSRAA